jgi:hypothetical protein
MIVSVASMNSLEIPGASGAGSGGSSRANLPLLNKLRETAFASSLALFKRALDATDDALFGFSEKSDSAAERSQFMDAMRSIRLGRPAIEQSFREQIASAFQAFMRGEVQGNKAKASAMDSSSLSLVEEGDLEEDLAVDGMSAKALVRHHSALFALQQRLAVVAGVKEVEVEAIPFGPVAICQALREVVRNIEADITVRLVVFKILDRHVVVDLDQVFDDTNRLLADAGILPNIKYVRPPRAAGESPAPRASAAGGDENQAGTQGREGSGSGPDSDASEVLSALASLLANRRGSSRVVAAGPAVQQQELIAALSRMQTHHGSIDTTELDVLSPMERVERVKQ